MSATTADVVATPRAVGSILFTDLVGFTAFTDAVGDAQAVEVASTPETRLECASHARR